MSSSPVLFLLAAVALSALGGMLVWLLNRPRKERFGSSIDAFHKDLDALAPPSAPPPRRAPGPRGNQRPGPGPRPGGG